ncbi:unnamed protein product [Moneuplotes crassus]|uniref:Uncharacterized protein n=1 Tax=Euplotes crassus TaxID=5936 RepID=A0AAD1U625_EUPCR|nr:unnamed protein product [Moneuplotes crassus]
MSKRATLDHLSIDIQKARENPRTPRFYKMFEKSKTLLERTHLGPSLIIDYRKRNISHDSKIKEGTRKHNDFDTPDQKQIFVSSSDIEKICEKYSIIGISKSSQFIPIDYKQKEGHTSQHSKMWRQMLRYIQDDSDSNALSKIILTNHCKKKILETIRNCKTKYKEQSKGGHRTPSKKFMLMDKFTTFKEFTFQELVYPLIQECDPTKENEIKLLLQLICDENYYYELKRTFKKPYKLKNSKKKFWRYNGPIKTYFSNTRNQEDQEKVLEKIRMEKLKLKKQRMLEKLRKKQNKVMSLYEINRHKRMIQTAEDNKARMKEALFSKNKLIKKKSSRRQSKLIWNKSFNTLPVSEASEKKEEDEPPRINFKKSMDFLDHSTEKMSQTLTKIIRHKRNRNSIGFTIRGRSRLLTLRSSLQSNSRKRKPKNKNKQISMSKRSNPLNITTYDHVFPNRDASGPEHLLNNSFFT